MKRTILVGFLLALATLSLAVAACGDDDDDANGDGGDGAPTDGADGSPTDGANGGGEELTLEAYITEVDDVQDGVTTAVNELGDLAVSFESPDRARQAVAAALDAGESAQSVLQGLNPPAEAQSQHDALLSASDNLVVAVQDIEGRLEGVQAGADFEQIKTDVTAADSDLNNALQEVSDACGGIQTLADDNGIEASIDCPASSTS